MTNKKLTHSHRKIDTVRCECGAKIKVIPDVRSMGEAIEIHVAVHLENMKPLADEDAEADRLRDVLIAQFFSLVLNQKPDSENDGSLV